MSESKITSISERKLAANRANAQKSTGPKTQAGKDVSRMNRLVHGLSAEIACIPGENPELYQAKRQSYAQFFEPKTQVEFDFVSDLALCRWRIDRYARYEAALLHAAIEKFKAKPPQDYDVMCPEVTAALAFQQLADTSNALDKLKRYETASAPRSIPPGANSLRSRKGIRPSPTPSPHPTHTRPNPSSRNRPNPPSRNRPNPPSR
jgi:hypothetical protein